MKRLHDFLSFFLAPLCLHLDDGGSGGGGAAPAPSGGAPDGAPPAGGGGTPASSGSTPPPATPTPQPSGTPAPATGLLNDKGEFNPGWATKHGLPAGYEKKFTSFESFAKSAYSLERMLSNGNKVAIPGPNATPEERAAFYNAIGRPEKPEDYGLKMPEKIGDKPFPKELWNDAKAGEFAKWAHERGLTKEQAAAIVEYDAARSLSDQEANAVAQQKAKESAITALKQEWGSDYEKNVKLAAKAAEQAGGADLMGHPLASDPVFIKAMAKVGQMIVEEDGGAAGARGSQHARTDPRAEINKMMGDRQHPYWVKNHPGHADAVKQMAALRAQLHPEPARA